MSQCPDLAPGGHSPNGVHAASLQPCTWPGTKGPICSRAYGAGGEQGAGRSRGLPLLCRRCRGWVMPLGLMAVWSQLSQWASEGSKGVTRQAWGSQSCCAWAAPGWGTEQGMSSSGASSLPAARAHASRAGQPGHSKLAAQPCCPPSPAALPAQPHKSLLSPARFSLAHVLNSCPTASSPCSAPCWVQ